MITEYTIGNFKAFSDPVTIPIRPITLIFGPNSSGKSSIFQSLLMLQQTLEDHGVAESALLINGDMVDLGNYRELIHDHRQDDPLSFRFKVVVAVEFSSRGLDHHVIRACAHRAGLTETKDKTVTNAIVDEARALAFSGTKPPSNTREMDERNQKPETAKSPYISERPQSYASSSLPAEPVGHGKEQRRATLVELLSNLTPEMVAVLTREKAKEGDLERPDFVWHFILQSFSTMGNSRGYQGLILNKTNYAQVTFDRLSGFSQNERLERLQRVFLQAGLRMPTQKARWAEEDYKIVSAMGGPEAAKERAL
jgi:hypothetical protein